MSTPSSTTMSNIYSEPIGILGAGVAGIINTYVFLQDGFTNVTVITRDRSVGGIWSRDRVYPGLRINNVHGEYRFSPLDMPPPDDSVETGGHITGMGMCDYIETFYEKFLQGKAKFIFETEVLNVRRDETKGWEVKVEGVCSKEPRVLTFSRIILATGGCSNPNIPANLSTEAAQNAQFKGLVIHSSQFRSRLDDIFELVKQKMSDDDKTKGTVVVVGGGKSAMDICAKLANEGRRVVNVFETADVFLAAKSALPDFIRKGRLLSLLSPHIVLRTRLERFFHTTTLGSWITKTFWKFLEASSFDAFSLPKDSPLRNTPSIFWGIRTNDEGRVNSKNYYCLVNGGQIELAAPARALRYSDDGKSLRLSNGQEVAADVVILATGWKSSWTQIFDGTLPLLIWISSSTIGTTRRSRTLLPPTPRTRRDFAIAGAIFTSNNGYTSEVAAHWISSYFQGDPMRLPSSPEEAVAEVELRSAWMRKRYPDMCSWVNESYSCTLDFWTWPQAADELLEDMFLPSMRSGGNLFTWPFQVIDLKEIATLGEERRVLREKATAS
ncbi:unnamed protein product [Cyclocybe aegerita]|uniref:FAD/NAD(P)-binding domain-containing protein n=1 Tax=Cyclocybe aegerita TaxID=1973307 RepID=A0A8S0X3L8_CYCAE|nr:unnamed protein product [Cyclocybe aegerita]